MTQTKEDPTIALVLTRRGVEIRYCDDDAVASERALQILSHLALSLDSLKQSLTHAFRTLDEQEALRSVNS